MLTQSQKTLIKATIPVLREHGTALSQHFYHRMLTNHPELKELFNLTHQRSGAQAKALAAAIIAYAENIDEPSVLNPVIRLISHKHVSLHIQAKDYPIVGENLLCSISEVLNISMQDPLIAAWAAAYTQLADILMAAEQKLYQQHLQQHGSWIGWRSFKIVRKHAESKQISSFYLSPVDSAALPSYQVGQYISLRVFVAELGIKQPRQYTLSSSPHSDYFRISVKREDAETDKAAGWVSTTLHRLPEGSELELTAPTGNFFLLDAHKTNVLISAGVGLTPMIAMLDHLITANVAQPIHFIHACRNGQQHAMKSYLQALKRNYPKLKTLIAYEFPDASDLQHTDYDKRGRLDLTHGLAELLPYDADYYLCGPMPFMQLQYQALLARGIPSTQIYCEAFTSGGVAMN